MNRSKSVQLMSEYGDYVFGGVDLLPNVIASGQGSFVTDVDGNKLLDLNAGQFCCIFGHSWPKMDAIIRKQLGTIGHTGTNTVSQDVLVAAKALSERCPGMSGKVIFLSTGAEAVECAMRFAKGVKKRNGFVCFKNGYHGLSLGSQSVTFGGQWALPVVDQIHSIAVPCFHELDEAALAAAMDASIEELQRLLASHGEEIAGLILEPIISVGGMIYLPDSYCERISDLCKKHDIFLVYDECQTGMGRTGTWFCYEHSKVIPDILVSAKAVGAGFPVSMVVFNGKTVDLKATSLGHYSSHQNDPLSAGIVTGVIEEIENGRLLEAVQDKGAYLLGKLVELSGKYSFIKKPRGRGLMLGFDIDRPGLTSYRQLGKEFLDRLLENGVMLQATSQGKTYRLLPNYLVSREEIDFLVAVLEKVIKEFEG
jgi:4-aminobutyrate aminotransferase-like enzyme